MAVLKQNGDIIPFLKQKDYVMVNNDLGGGSFGKTVLLQDPFIDELFVAKKFYRFSDYLGTTPQMSELLGLSSISGILRFGRYPAYHGISEPHLAVKSSKTVVENRPYY